MDQILPVALAQWTIAISANKLEKNIFQSFSKYVSEDNRRYLSWGADMQSVVISFLESLTKNQDFH